MKLFIKMTSALALITAFTLSSCEKEEIDLNIVAVNGMTVTLTPEAGGEAQSFTMSTTVVDDAGREFGTYKEEHISLKPNTTYNATVTFFSDEGGIHTEQNESIRREEGHYTVNYKAGTMNVSNMKTDVEVTVTDAKANGSPLGFNTKFKTGNAGIDVLHIELFVSKSLRKSSMSGTVYNSTYWIDVQN